MVGAGAGKEIRGGGQRGKKRWQKLESPRPARKPQVPPGSV